jgi:TonB family protein
MSAYAFSEGVHSHRMTVFMGIVGLHMLVIVALITQVIATDPTKAPGVLQTVVVDEFKTPDNPPRLPDLRFYPVAGPVDLNPSVPIIPTVESVVIPPEGIGTITETAGSVVPAIPATGVGYTALRSPDTYYPQASVEQSEYGATVVNACVNANGRLDGLPSVAASSGFARLDAAAVKWVSEAVRFTPATEAGKAIHACKGFKVNFRLRNLK